jgi:hypothetical protein
MRLAGSNRFTPTILSQAVAFQRISSQAALQSLAIGCALSVTPHLDGASSVSQSPSVEGMSLPLLRDHLSLRSSSRLTTRLRSVVIRQMAPAAGNLPEVWRQNGDKRFSGSVTA